ncbi:CU044_5270 family protein [Streptomyces sp. NPDC048636]|uniref:CU044_5270 family protein n=1 Tax=Streptomyces sp. NPDC048636 TaxID=3155762 RepID=UPI00341882F5
MHDKPRNDIELLREWDTGEPPLSGEARDRARDRLLAAMDQQAGGPVRTVPAAVRPRRRPVLRIALAACLAAAATAGVLVAADHGSDSGGAKARPGGVQPRLANVSAATVLRGAAVAERKREKDLAPRDDQFVYTKEIIKETSKRSGETKSYTDETWRSVDDSKRSWIMEIGHGWWSDPVKENESVWPPQDWTRLEALPTDPDKLLIAVRDWMLYDKPRYDKPVGKKDWGDIEFGLAGLLYRVPVMPKGLRPAAYEALAKIPGVKATPGEKDANGREGIAISYKGEAGLSAVFIFAPGSYEYLGMRDTRTSGGKVFVQRSYLADYAVVDKAKQRPQRRG